MINPKAELYIWGPIDGKECYIDPWMRAMYPAFVHWKTGWPDLFSFFFNNKITCISEASQIGKSWGPLFLRYLDDDNGRNTQFQAFVAAAEKLKKVEKDANDGFSTLTN